MLAILGILLMTTIFASAVLGSLFQRSLRREAPQLYEKLYANPPSGRLPVLRTGRIVEMARLILLRGYCTALAEYPCSRAYASWMFANDWLQIVGVALLVAVILGR
jgi:hypothetical protein